MVEAHAPEAAFDTIAPLLRKADRALLLAMNAKEAMAVFEDAEVEALAVIDGSESRRVIGLLTASHVLRRYGEEIEKRRQEEVGLV
ncbi:hypothetical protein GCM10011320_14220 [Neoroseomonas lacus]|uniref:CBS domain-containing protein n=2 Tax=Neoroseomonas lacus TaxID=287609 RepID=A0A917KEP7_9PROT|nr:hypothetical protein GCM10011320_14220 [Neoroseomonas lacus]